MCPKPPASTIVKANDKNDQNNSYERIDAELDEGPLLFFSPETVEIGLRGGMTDRIDLVDP